MRGGGGGGGIGGGVGGGGGGGGGGGVVASWEATSWMWRLSVPPNVCQGGEEASWRV